jgi:hypothetical protein
MSISLREVFGFSVFGFVKSGTAGHRIAWYIFLSKLKDGKQSPFGVVLTVACQSKDAERPFALKDVLPDRI